MFPFQKTGIIIQTPRVRGGLNEETRDGCAAPKEGDRNLCHRPFSPGMSLGPTSTPRFPRVATASPSTQPQGSSLSLGHTNGHPTGNPGLKGQHVLRTEHVTAEGCGSRASTWTREPRPGLAGHLDRPQCSAGWESENHLKILYPEQGFLIKGSSSGLFLEWGSYVRLKGAICPTSVRPGQVCGERAGEPGTQVFALGCSSPPISKDPQGTSWALTNQISRSSSPGVLGENRKGLLPARSTPGPPHPTATAFFGT